MYARNGFTLIELLIGIVVIGIALLGIISGYIGCLRINEMSRNTTIAMEDSRRVIEQMRNYSMGTLGDIVAEDWTSWAVSRGLTRLDNEVITVNYTDRDGTGSGFDDDPLAVTVTVAWQDKDRPRSLQFSTLITVR